jgi:hypothetical protein
MKTFRAITPDGCLHKRQSPRGYTHVIAVRERDGRWRVIAWCGSLALAQRKLRTQRPIYLTYPMQMIAIENPNTPPAPPHAPP